MRLRSTAVVGPYSARFQPLPTRGDIRTVLADRRRINLAENG